MYEFDATLWRWREDGAWHFLSLPESVTDEIDDLMPQKAGFGSVKVEVTCGATTWQTSLFPSNGLQAYVLPLKKAVRAAEGLDIGDTAHVHLRLIDR